MKRITIKDLAAHAKVSRGTVDRVLHNRGQVSQEVKDKIQRAIKDLGYKPNIIARTLAQNNDYNIAVLIPNPEMDEFWNKPYQGIEEVLTDVETFGVSVNYYYFDNNDVTSFIDAGKRILSDSPDGILMASEFYHESLELLDKINARGIPVSLIMTQVDHELGSNYIGQDSFQSGVVVGRLFDTTVKDSEKHILIINLGAFYNNTLQIQKKVEGLKKYFNGREEFKMYMSEELYFKDEKLLRDKIISALNDHPQVNGIFVTNSRSKYIADIVKEFQRERDICFIGYDIIADNITYLNNGVIDYLINQNPDMQGAKGMKRLVDHLVYDRDFGKAEYIPSDIVIKENVAFYID